MIRFEQIESLGTLHLDDQQPVEGEGSRGERDQGRVSSTPHEWDFRTEHRLSQDEK